MTKEEELYHSIGDKRREVEKSQMFGVQCLKINGKPFANFYYNEVVFKLTGESYKDALSLGLSAFLTLRVKGAMGVSAF